MEVGGFFSSRWLLCLAILLVLCFGSVSPSCRAGRISLEEEMRFFASCCVLLSLTMTFLGFGFLYNSTGGDTWQNNSNWVTLFSF